jgi:hypothetical protein
MRDEVARFPHKLYVVAPSAPYEVHVADATVFRAVLLVERSLLFCSRLDEALHDLFRPQIGLDFVLGGDVVGIEPITTFAVILGAPPVLILLLCLAELGEEVICELPQEFCTHSPILDGG